MALGNVIAEFFTLTSSQLSESSTMLAGARGHFCEVVMCAILLTLPHTVIFNSMCY